MERYHHYTTKQLSTFVFSLSDQPDPISREMRQEALDELHERATWEAPAPKAPLPQYSTPTGKLRFSEWQTLANLLRRFEVHHTNGLDEKLTVQETDLLIRDAYGALYVPGHVASVKSTYADDLRAARQRGMDEENRRQRSEETYRTLVEMSKAQNAPVPNAGDLFRAFLNLEHGEALEEHRARGFDPYEPTGLRCRCPQGRHDHDVPPAAAPVEREHVDGLAMTAGPNPITVSELLNENDVTEITNYLPGA